MKRSQEPLEKYRVIRHIAHIQAQACYGHPNFYINNACTKQKRIYPYQHTTRNDHDMNYTERFEVFPDEYKQAHRYQYSNRYNGICFGIYLTILNAKAAPYFFFFFV